MDKFFIELILVVIISCLAVIVIFAIKIKKINRNYALYCKMMDEKKKNDSLFWKLLKQNNRRYFENPILMLQNPQIQELIEKDENIIAQICALGKRYENIKTLRLDDNLKQLALDYENMRERNSQSSSSKIITH